MIWTQSQFLYVVLDPDQLHPDLQPIFNIFWLLFHFYFHSNLVYKLGQDFLDGQHYFQIELRNSIKMIFNFKNNMLFMYNK